MTLTYSYLVSWILGGLTLVTIVFLRTRRRPYWLSLALMSFGATGFLALGFAAGPTQQTLLYAGVAALCGAALGVGIERIGAQPEAPPSL